jgi:hypothetical protein
MPSWWVGAAHAGLVAGPFVDVEGALVVAHLNLEERARCDAEAMRYARCTACADRTATARPGR